jgi:hypothetical protein
MRFNRLLKGQLYISATWQCGATEMQYDDGSR